MAIEGGGWARTAFVDRALASCSCDHNPRSSSAKVLRTTKRGLEGRKRLVDDELGCATAYRAKLRWWIARPSVDESGIGEVEW